MDGQTDRQIDRRKYLTRVISAFREYAKMPRKEGLSVRQKEREKL